MDGLLVNLLSVIYDYKKIGIWQTSEAAQAAVYGVKTRRYQIGRC